MDILMLALLFFIAATAAFAWLAAHHWRRAIQLERERDDAITHITTARGLAYDSGFARGERSMAGEMVRAAMRAMREGRDIVAAVVGIARLAEPIETDLTIQV